MPAKCTLTILEIDWYQRFCDKKKKLKFVMKCSRLPYGFKTCHSRWGKDDKGSEMYNDEKCTCKACKILFFFVKYTNLWQCCRRCRVFLSSLLSDGLPSLLKRERGLSLSHHQHGYVCLVVITAQEFHKTARRMRIIHAFGTRNQFCSFSIADRNFAVFSHIALPS